MWEAGLTTARLVVIIRNKGEVLITLTETAFAKYREHVHIGKQNVRKQTRKRYKKQLKRHEKLFATYI